MSFISYAVRNYALTLVLFVMVVVVGALTLFTMPRAEDPIIRPPQFPIVAVYPGTSPQDMEELIVKPIEKRVYELEQINKIVTNIENGLAVLQVEFNYGVDVTEKYQELIREVNNLRPTLPKELYSLEVRKVDPTDVNILQLALVSENAGYRELDQQADRIKSALEKVPALKKITYSGIPDEVVRIDLDIAKLARMNIPLPAVIGSIQSESANIPGGSIQLGTNSFNVKTSGKYLNPTDIGETVVYQRQGKIILLRDVAKVTQRFEAPRYITRVNGYRCVLITAAQKDGVNIANTQQALKPILENLQRDLPANMKLIPTFEQAKNVENRLAGLGKDFLIAIGLVLITLLPLGTRASFIVMISIPLSLALGLVGLNAFGFSLNQLSIVGLVVALGLLVDDSIVVVENIERWIREGHSPWDASIKATGQIAGAVVGCTATLIIAFLPLVFLPGAPGEFIRGLPMAVITSVLASLVVSLTIVPFLASRFLKPHKQAGGNVFLQVMQRGINKSYGRLLEIALRRPVAALIVSFGLFAGSLALFGVIGFRLFPTSEKPIFLINIRHPQQTHLTENNRVTKMIEDSLRKIPAIKFFTSNVGKGNPQVYYNVPQQREKEDFSQLFIQMDDDASPSSKRKLIERLRLMFDQFPYANVQVKDFEQGPPIEAPIAIRLIGDNLDTLRKLAAATERILKAHPGAIYVNNETNQLKSDIRLRINRDKARMLGVQTADIDQLVRLAITGQVVGSYTDIAGDDYDIRVHVPGPSYPNLDVFKQLFIHNNLGVAVALDQIATISFETSPVIISHLNKERFARITAFTKEGVLANDVLKEVLPQLQAMKLPPQYSIKLAGEAESEGDAFGGNFMSVILFTVFLFIAVLILQFKTFKGTWIVLSVIPLGIVGGVSMLFLTSNPMSFVAIIGFIGLAGVEVKNSILLVDFTNQLRREGMELNQAIEQAGETRFLPVVLTSLTAIGGLLPIAFSTNPLIAPLALVLIGGLISSTLLSRIVTPVMYKLIPPRIDPA